MTTNPTPSQKIAAKLEFAASANNFKEAALELTRAWEVADRTGDTPSDVAGYPFKESFDELVLAIIDWNHNINEWANQEAAVLESSTFEFATIAARDEFIEQNFPKRAMQDTPGCYALPDGGSLSVNHMKVTVYEGAA